MRDFYPDDMRRRRLLFDAWRDAACRAGFEEYDACVVESLDLLKRKAGEEIVEQIYAFKDKSGRDLALRPEMTPSLARLIAARQGALSFPVKWWTIAQCFRYERTTRGRKREHYQWNLDIIGEDSVAAEAEVIAVACAALGSLGLGSEHYRVRYSNRALLGELLESMGIESEHHQAAFLALDKRGKIDEAAIEELLAAEGVRHETARRVLGLLELTSFDDVASRVSGGSSALAATRAFVDLCGDYGLGDLLAFDLSVIRGLSYYTGLVFEAFDVDRKFRAIFGGGRYDNLLADVGGQPRSGVGLGFGDVVVAELLEELGLGERSEGAVALSVGFMEEGQRSAAVRFTASRRRAGQNVALSCKPEKPRAFFSRAAKSGCAEAAYIGPDDVEAGLVRVKNMATREERTAELP
jgi:histidyl-tRNA synthetase